MFKRFLLILCSFLFLVSIVEARSLGGVDMEESLKEAGNDLILNGAGIRTKFIGIMDKQIYVAGLYLKEKNSDFQKIIDMDENMAIRIKITSKLITSERFKEACEEGFNRTLNGNTASMRQEIDLAYTAFDQKFNVGDVYDIAYEKGVGTKFSRNGQLITTVKGLDFKKALFGIWIIDNPSHKNENLREGMLGMK